MEFFKRLWVNWSGNMFSQPPYSTDKSGSCLYSSVNQEMKIFCKANDLALRLDTVEFLIKNKSMFEAFVTINFFDYTEAMKSPDTWGSELEICAMRLFILRKMDLGKCRIK
jgi:hypothetical protein